MAYMVTKLAKISGVANLSKFGPDMIKPLLNDIHFCEKARRAGLQESLGFLLFSITPALPFGKTIAEPKPHPMVVLKFASKGKG